jgi:hypothetical protein
MILRGRVMPRPDRASGPAKLALDTPDWMRENRLPCSNEQVRDLFFSDDRAEQREAKAICGECPFVERCDAYATHSGERHGVWGGRLRSGKPERPSTAEPAAPEQTSDEELVARSLVGNGCYFRKLTDEQKRVVIRAARWDGWTWPALAQNLKHRVALLQTLAGEPTLDDRVRELHAQELSDQDIGLRLGVTPNAVYHCRKRLSLPALYGPGGHRRVLEQAVPA